MAKPPVREVEEAMRTAREAAKRELPSAWAYRQAAILRQRKERGGRVWFAAARRLDSEEAKERNRRARAEADAPFT